MRTCRVCKLQKDVTNFHLSKSRKDGLQTRCKQCQSIASKASYIRKPEDTRARSKRIRLEKRQFVRDQKCKPCKDCGVQYNYYVMQFDHLGDKKFNISRRLTHFSMKQIKEELIKCDVVCANCHAERSYNRFSRQTGIEPILPNENI